MGWIYVHNSTPCLGNYFHIIATQYQVSSTCGSWAKMWAQMEL
jgi:hypothetical protein